jgi:2-dehydro-3-deoxyglucarate aldolase
MKNPLKTKLKNNELTIGSWITLGNTSVAEIMAQAGFEWLTIDMGAKFKIGGLSK